MNFSRIGYALLCIVAPLLWGLCVVSLSNRVERQVRRHQKKAEAEPAMSPVDYHI